MAPNSTIFGANESSERDLFLENVSKERNERKVFKKFEKFGKKIEKVVHMIFGSLYYRPRFMLVSSRALKSLMRHSATIVPLKGLINRKRDNILR